jgi:hypothetical protein
MSAEYEKMCETSLQFDDWWMQQPCSDRRGVLHQMGEWYRLKLSPANVLKMHADVLKLHADVLKMHRTTNVVSDAQRIYPKYYAHFMAMAGAPVVMPKGFFDLAASVAKHSTKPLLQQKLAVADDVFQALFQFIASKQPTKALCLWKELLDRFKRWQNEPTMSFKDHDIKNPSNLSTRYWPLFATIAIARGTDGDLTTMATAANAKVNANAKAKAGSSTTASVSSASATSETSATAFVTFEDPQICMAKPFQTPAELCVPLFELLEVMRAIHDFKFVSEFEVAITQLEITKGSTSATTSDLVTRLALEAIPISAPFYQKQRLLFQKCTATK